jgi:peptide/nickel transport system substrate-binding protein
MLGEREQSRALEAASRLAVLGWLVVLIGTARCSNRSGPVTSQAPATLRVGIGGLPQLSTQNGLRQLVANLSLEGLVNLTEDGRPRPFIAESWTTAPDGLSLSVRIRPKARFHDGTPVTASAIVPTLQANLPKAMGPAFDDIKQIVALDDARILFRLHRPSPLLIEALEMVVQKPDKGAAGTGAFVPAGPTSPRELTANDAYYLGRPAIRRIAMTPYPSVRAAWAELLRGNLDMLYEVNADALDSLQSSSDVSVFSFVRHYQYLIVFGSRAPVFKSAEVRRELNAAIDRDVLIREGLNGHGIPSSGPVPPRHWALDSRASKLAFDPKMAARLSGQRLRFRCLVPSDSVYERIALAVKRQLSAAGVDMQVEEATQEQIVEAGTKNDFEAILLDSISGPSIFRSYQRWHSGGPFGLKTINSAAIDGALDRVRHAASDDEYRSGVTAFQQAVVDAPPAIFLAWSERARAVSRRFDVPVQEDGRDILATLYQWRPRVDQRATNSN